MHAAFTGVLHQISYSESPLQRLLHAIRDASRIHLARRERHASIDKSLSGRRAGETTHSLAHEFSGSRNQSAENSAGKGPLEPLARIRHERTLTSSLDHSGGDRTCGEASTERPHASESSASAHAKRSQGRSRANKIPDLAGSGIHEWRIERLGVGEILIRLKSDEITSVSG